MKLDLSNANGLDESIQNQYSGCCGADGEAYSNNNGASAGASAGGGSNVDYAKLATQVIGLGTQVAGAVKADQQTQVGGGVSKGELKAVCGRPRWGWASTSAKRKYNDCKTKYIASKTAQNQKAPEPVRPTAQEVQDKINALKLAQKEREKAKKFLGMPKGLGIAVAVLGGLALVVGGIVVVRKMNK